MLFLSIITLLTTIAATILWKQRSRLPVEIQSFLLISGFVFSLSVLFGGTMTLTNQVCASLAVLSYYVLIYLVWRDKNVNQH
jgi:hypothetical protein